MLQLTSEALITYSKFTVSTVSKTGLKKAGERLRDWGYKRSEFKIKKGTVKERRATSDSQTDCRVAAVWRDS